MKKVTCMMLIAVMLTVGHFGIAENIIDLSSYSDEEIAALFEQVQIEMVSRGIGKTAIFAKGKYKVGEGQYIPPGSYVIKTTEIGSDWGIIQIRTPDDPEDDIPSKLYKFVEAELPYVGYLMLEEGDFVDSPVSFTLTISVPAAVFK